MSKSDLNIELPLCPLCNSTGKFSPVTGPMRRGYLLCPHCQLIFMERNFLPDSQTEEARYRAHQNTPLDSGYVQFLMQAITPALPYLNDHMLGLDYGCGPTPTLAELLKNQGIHCKNYDPYFYPAFPEHPFDFIFATEVVEHFYQPDDAFQCMSGLLRPGGILTIMTEPWVSIEKFSEWHYAKDNTHVSFYNSTTISFISERYGFEILNNQSSRVTVLKKHNI